MQLSQEFLDKMHCLLQDQYADFLKSYEQEKQVSLRINTLKAIPDAILNQHLFTFSPVSWCPTGFYYPLQERPGRHSYHHAGLFYIQEASAMAVVECADIHPYDKVLDLCAAPGGKSTQIACKLQGQGLQVANEIVPSRAKILSQNIERMGVQTAIVTSENPQKLEKYFKGFFNKIIVDAPCSGEGMFRKDPAVIDQWSPQQVLVCANRQEQILESAHEMLAENGTLVYSTCTFSWEENEQVIFNFLEKHPEYTIIRPALASYFAEGMPAAIPEKNEPSLKNTMRLFPHQIKGEGHFIAVLSKTTSTHCNIKPKKYNMDNKILAPFHLFKDQFLKNVSLGNLILFGEHLYAVPPDAPDMNGLKVLRMGLHLGELKKGRFEPSHSLALFLTTQQVSQWVNYTHDSTEINDYLHGHTLPCDENLKGWVLVCIDNYSLGWGKAHDGILKNHYPKGLRIAGV